MKKLFLSFFIIDLVLSIYAMNNGSAVVQNDDSNVIVQLLGRSRKKEETRAYDPKHYYFNENGTVSSIEYSIEIPFEVVKESTTLCNNITDCNTDTRPLIIIGNTIKGVCPLSLAITLNMMKEINQEKPLKDLAKPIRKLRKKRYLLMLINTASFLNCKQPIPSLYATRLLEKLDALILKKDKLEKALKFCKLLADNDQYNYLFELACENLDETNFEYLIKSSQRIQTHGDVVGSICFINDGKNIITGSEDVRIWNAQTGELTSTLCGHKGFIHAVSCSPRENKCASSSADTTVRIWNLENNKCLFVLRGHKKTVSAVYFSSDGSKLASCSDDTTIKMWDVCSGNCLQTITGHRAEVHAVCFSSDSLKLASCSSDKTVKIWDISDIANIKCCYTLDKPHGDNTVLDVGFSPDGTQVASTGYDQILKLWDVATGDCIKKFEGHIWPVNSLCFSPDGYYLLSGANDKTIRLWHIKKQKCLLSLEHINDIYSVCFSPNGRRIAAGSRDTAFYIYTFYNLKSKFTLPALLLLKYLNNKRLKKLPVKPLYLEIFAQLPKKVRLQFPELFDYNELAKKLRARKQK